MLLHSLEYPEDATSDIFQRQIDRYEDNLKRLEAQENKYAGELEAALSEYAELKEQASGFVPCSFIWSGRHFDLTERKQQPNALKRLMATSSVGG